MQEKGDRIELTKRLAKQGKGRGAADFVVASLENECNHFRWNLLDEPGFMMCSKLLLTKFGIYYLKDFCNGYNAQYMI